MDIVHTKIWDRTATSDLWIRTLAQIPSLFGRLVYLSSLRDVNTDEYQHHGLATMFGEEQTHRALRDSHELTFAEWLNFDMENQKADLDLYLSGLDTPKRTLLQTWLRIAPYKNFIPSSAGDDQRAHYLMMLETLLQLLRNEYAGGQAASRRPSPDR